MMKIIFYLSLLFMVLSMLWTMWSNWKYRKDFQVNREKASAFECGFDGKNSFRSAFSFRFFYILIMFLIFDMELALLFAFPVETSYKSFLNLNLEMILFMLTIGVLYEWKKGALKWKE